MEVEGVVADAPGGGALFLCIADGVSLTIDAWLHNMVLADRTVVDMDICRNGYVKITQRFPRSREGDGA